MKTFDKYSIKEHHRQKIEDILDQGGGVDDIVNYLMSRIATVISYERRKNERRQLRQWSNKNEKKKRSSRGPQ